MSGARPVPGGMKKPTRLKMASSTRRIRVFAGVLAALILVMAGRSMQLQIFDAGAYAALAEEQIRQTVPLQPSRGLITDRHGVALAQSQPAVKVIADPLMLRRNGVDRNRELTDTEKAKAAKAPEAVAELLSEYLGGTSAEYLEKMKDESSQYAVIKRQVPAYTYQRLRDALREGNWNGIHSEFDPIRSYPAGSLAANVVGFVDTEGKGQSGLEYAYNAQLAGATGKQIFDAAQWGRVPLGTNVLTPAVDGANFELTLDAEMQWMAEKALAAGVQNADGATGTAIIMNVKTGEVLAMANVPGFDAGDPGKAKTSDLGNRAVTDAYEPGSVQKILTMAALIDSGVATPDTKLEVPGEIRSGNNFIKDAWSHDTLYLTARGMVAKSSNVAAVQLGRKLDKEKFSSYLKNFGLGAPTGIGLPGEAAGSVPDGTMADYTRDQVSFGSGLSVTAVQMAAAVAGVVNGGVYNPPTIIRSAKAADGTPLDLPKRQSRQVISAESSAQVLDSMEAVMSKEGGAPALAIDGYRTAGKTGTAIRYDQTCKCYSGYTASFAGVAPAEDPQILVYVVIDQPKHGHFGSEVAGPVYKELMQVALPRYGVLPSTSAPRQGEIEYKK